MDGNRVYLVLENDVRGRLNTLDGKIFKVVPGFEIFDENIAEMQGNIIKA